MIISFEHRFIYVAIPKTASQSIRSALRPHLGEKDWEQCVLLTKKYFPVQTLADLGHGHISYQQLEPFLLKGMWDDFLTFTTVRNPYDRFVSFCFFIHRESKTMQQNPSEQMKRIAQDKTLLSHLLCRPQCDFIEDNKGNITIDRILKTELLQQNFESVCKKIQGIPNKISLPHINTSSRKHHQHYIDNELQNMLVDIYARDFEQLGYSSELEQS